METVLVFAKQTGRTLVMPPAQKFYLLNRPAVEFADMFPIEYLSDYMEVMSMEVRGLGGLDVGRLEDCMHRRLSCPRFDRMVENVLGLL